MLCKTHRDANSLTGYWCYFKNTFHKDSTEGNINNKHTSYNNSRGEVWICKNKTIFFLSMQWCESWRVVCIYMCEWQRAVCDLLSSVSLWMLELMLCTRTLGSSGDPAWYDMVEVCKVTWELSEEQALCVTSPRADWQKLAIYQTFSRKMEQTKSFADIFNEKMIFLCNVGTLKSKQDINLKRSVQRLQ